ncbi:MAG: hypothetical protein ACXVPN_13360 [Bacteroidia bacterium]
MQVKHALNYSDVFPREMTPSLESLLEQVSTIRVLEYLTYFNGVLHMNAFESENQQKCLSELIGGQSKDLRTRLGIALMTQKNRYGANLVFDIYANLLAINSAIVNANTKKAREGDETVKDKEIILKIVLVANLKVNNETLFEDKSTDKLELFCKLMWPTLVYTSDHRVRTDFLVNAFKGFTFLEYIKTKPEIVEHFIKYLMVKSAEEVYTYIRDILRFYILVGIDKENNRLFHLFTFDIEGEHSFLKNYVIDFTSGGSKDYKESDFNSLRKKPIIKIGEKRYLMSNWNFFIEKLGTGLLFELFYNTDLHKEYLDKDGKPQLGDFKAKLGFDYSEKMFHKVVNESVFKPGDYLNTGDPQKKYNSDYYLRRGNKIALIEFKDALMIKHKTYEDIKNELDKKLNKDNKGTGQLKSHLDKLANQINVFEADLDKKINTKKLVVYPVIMVTEGLFSAPGFSQYLDKELKKRIGGTKYPFYVKPLIVVDFDFMLQAFDGFRGGYIDFFIALEVYNYTRLKAKGKARRSGDINQIVKSFNGFRENAWNYYYRRTPKRAFNTLSMEVMKGLNLPDFS